MTTIIRILRDFKPILNLDLYGEHMPEERITGSKIDVDLSVGSTYTQVYIVVYVLIIINFQWCVLFVIRKLCNIVSLSCICSVVATGILCV